MDFQFAKQDLLWDYRAILGIAAALLICGEMIFRTLRYGHAPSVKTTIQDGLIFGADLSFRAMSLGARLFVFVWLGQFVPWRLEANVWTILLAYVLIDFFYYWKHRLFHRTRLGWALHATHHCSPDLNFLSTFRVNWIESGTTYYFFLPVIALGLDPWLVFMLIEINRGWQVLVHTEFRLPSWLRWLDRFVNTPDIHRVHHSVKREHADTNYASTFMIWDQLFGTYYPGLPHVEPGVKDGIRRNSIFGIQFGGLLNWLRERVFSSPSAAKSATES